jgi:deoxyribodipyrimidine photo-lyase
MTAQAPLFRRSLHIFRRDLRLFDNTALNQALSQSKEVLTCFILDPRQVEEHPYRSTSGLQFMLTSLKELGAELAQEGGALQILHGESSQVLTQILKEEKIEAVFFNRDYTPFSRKRDRALKELCDQQGVKIFQYGDALLQEPEAVAKKTGGPYTVYTPFMKCASQMAVREPSNLSNGQGHLASFSSARNPEKECAKIPLVFNDKLLVKGGREEALRILSDLSPYKEFDKVRDFPALRATTCLSAHHKFGTVSAREVYWKVSKAFGSGHTLIRELFWRDFFTHIAFHFPHVFQGAFHPRYDKIAWENDPEKFSAWCEGRTGFPIVDAGMRELNATGFMHNRVRMIVASFLVKDLLIDWRWGERYFAQKLVDYDPAVNNGNWQWAASTGCDAQPYFRIFNPWLQQERFDEDARYIKHWVPELKSYTPKQLGELAEKPLRIPGYPVPLVDHAEQKTRVLRLFEEAGSTKA